MTGNAEEVPIIQNQYILMQILVESLDLSHDLDKRKLRHTVDEVRRRLEERFKDKYISFNEVYGNRYSSGTIDHTSLFQRNLRLNQPLSEEDITDFLEELKGRNGFEGLKYKFIIFDAMPFREERTYLEGDIDGHDGGHPQDRD